MHSTVSNSGFIIKFLESKKFSVTKVFRVYIVIFSVDVLVFESLYLSVFGSGVLFL